MPWRRNGCAILVLVASAACTRRPAPPPTQPAEPVHEPLCAASLKLAHACTGATRDLEMCSIFTTATVTSEITNNIDIDLVFATGMAIVDGRGEELLPAVLGPGVRVPAQSTGQPWQIALPRLPDGYVLITVMALGTSADGERATYSEGQLRVRDGQVEVLEYWAWHDVTDPMNVHEFVPGQPAPAGPTPGERLYEQLRAQTKRPATP